MAPTVTRYTLAERRFAAWSRHLPEHVRVRPIPGQEPLALDEEAVAHHRHLERWGSVHKPLGKPYESAGRMLIDLDTIAAVPLERVAGIGECPVCGDELHYHPAINEDGWRCCCCDYKPGEPAGYDPFLDKYLTAVKVFALAHDLADAKIIYFSNGSHLDGVVGSVTRRCQEAGSYTQERIVSLLTTSVDVEGYWDRQAAAIISGNDQRPRCPGGRLSTWSTGAGDTRVERCFNATCTACASGVDPF